MVAYTEVCSRSNPASLSHRVNRVCALRTRLAANVPGEGLHYGETNPSKNSHVPACLPRGFNALSLYNYAHCQQEWSPGLSRGITPPWLKPGVRFFHYSRTYTNLTSTFRIRWFVVRLRIRPRDFPWNERSRGREALHATPLCRHPLAGAARRSRAAPENEHGRGPQAPAPPPRRSLVEGRMARPCGRVTSKRYYAVGHLPTGFGCGGRRARLCASLGGATRGPA